MTAEELKARVKEGESLSLEWKGEERSQLSDSDIYDAVVCLANTEGGLLLIGVENDRRITGARPRHGRFTDPARLQASILGNLSIPQNIECEVVTVDGVDVIAIQVPRSNQAVSTKKGACFRRVVKIDGPACVPYYPHEHARAAVSAGEADYSAFIHPSADVTNLDPVEFARLRRFIERLGGDTSLASLDNLGLAKALELIETRPDGALGCTIAGLLLLSNEASINRLVPTHEVAFQVFGPRREVKVNEFLRRPLLATLEYLEDAFGARNETAEVDIGILRIPIPAYSPEGFREALNNALLHRDYSALGTVHVQWSPDQMEITNPGGFPAGITLDNLLTHEPKPRNRRLADAFKRIGLVERTGRGIDRIFEGQLRYGRPAPDYSLSRADAVRVLLFGGRANLAFVRLVEEAARTNRTLTLDELLILNEAQRVRRLDTADVGRLIQKSEPAARAALERLVERGLLQAKGERRGRVFHLSAQVYRALGEAAAYVRTRGFEPIQQEQMVLNLAATQAQIRRADVMDLCNLTGDQATKLLSRLVDGGKLVMRGSRRGTRYTIPSEEHSAERRTS